MNRSQYGQALFQRYTPAKPSLETKEETVSESAWPICGECGTDYCDSCYKDLMNDSKGG